MISSFVLRSALTYRLRRLGHLAASYNKIGWSCVLYLLSIMGDRATKELH
jgi:hypothetical protein